MLRIRICKRCGCEVCKSNLNQYDYQCLHCDEDLFDFETIVIEDKEQNSIDKSNPICYNYLIK